jgi:hypothetical protein
MIYMAEIIDGIVARIVVVNDASWPSKALGGTWVETSTNGIRKNFACVGYAYDVGLDAFIPPKPYQSWLLNQESCQWEPPTPMPLGGPWEWDEENGTWFNPIDLR